MKKIFTTCILLCSLIATAVAVTVNDVAGTFKGNLNIGGTNYTNQEVYILPGTTNNAVTLVLPSVAFSSKCADLVLVDMTLNSNGTLAAGSAAAYVKQISASSLSVSSLSFTFSVSTPAMSEPATVTFSGSKSTDKNYAITNGGFEGNWSNNEPTGWHSFVTASGSYASFVSGNTDQFSQQSDVRPGSSGSNSARLQSKTTLGVKANGNCSNGRINAGSMSATDASGNYSYSDPSSSGYNTPFAGSPDSLVFWAKYIPGGGNVTDSDNKARAHAVITTNARYQDPETSDYSTIKIAEATSNYSATSDKGWQRLSVPFEYTALSTDQTAYILVTFTTNATPGGGQSTKKSPDNVYLDDAEVVYNHSLTSFTLDGTAISFTNGAATTSQVFSDKDYTLATTTNAKGAKSFIGYDAVNNKIAVYVVANNYSQARAYSLYTLQMAEPVKDTYYEYAASTCNNEPYSDELFQNLTEAGEYHVTIPNTQGGDSLITLTLSVLPTYSIPATATIRMDESYSWHGQTYEHLAPDEYSYTDSLQTKAGCDSIYTLTLTVEAIPYMIDEAMSACQHEEATWHGKALPTDQAGEVVVFDSLTSVYGADSVYRLTLTVHPTYLIAEEATIIMDESYSWHGHTYEHLVPGEYTYTDSLTSKAGCDSVYTLRLAVKPIGYYEFNEEMSVCLHEEASWRGKTLPTDQAGTVLIDDSLKSIYGMDSIYRLHLTIHPTYLFPEEATIRMDESYSWHGQTYEYLAPGEYNYTDSLQTQTGCDSIYTLALTVEAIPYAFSDSLTACQHEEATWRGKALPTEQTGEFIVYDSLQSMYATDSVYTLTLIVLPTYFFTEEASIYTDESYSWRGYTYEHLEPGEYTYADSLNSQAGCDSVYTLALTVKAPEYYLFDEEMTTCLNEEATWRGKTLPTDQTGEVVVYDSLLSVHHTDSVYRLTLSVYPTYLVDEYLTITMGENKTWEVWNLSAMPVGKSTLYASYSTANDCDSTLVLHLTVEPVTHEALPGTPQADERCAQKILINGHLYIVRKDETLYDILGKKIQ